MGFLSKLVKPASKIKHYTLHVLQEDKKDSGETILGNFFNTEGCQRWVSLIPHALPEIKENTIIKYIPIEIFKEIQMAGLPKGSYFLNANFPDETHDGWMSFYYNYLTMCNIPISLAKEIFIPLHIKGVTLYIKHKSDITYLPDILNNHFLGKTDNHYDYTEEFWKLVIIPLVSIFQCCCQEAVDSFAPGIVNTMEKMEETAHHASIAQRREMLNQTSLFLKDLCLQLLDMGAYKKYDIGQETQKAIDAQNLDDKIEKLGIHPDKINEEEVNEFLSYIQGRKELLNQFNDIK